MKKNYALLTGAVLLFSTVNGQNPANCNASNCTTNSTIDVCAPGGSTVVTNFQNPVQKAGNPCTSGLCANSVWRYSNVASVNGSQVDAEVRIVAISNAVLQSIDDNSATDHNGSSIASFFAPRIGPDVNLNNSNRRGFVEFEIRFYQNYPNSALNFITLQPLTGLNFVHYDIDGQTNGPSGWFRELGNIKEISTFNPVLNAAGSTELTTDAGAGAGWKGFLGSVCERTGVSRCAEVAVSATYNGAVSTVNFRMGYDYRAGASAGNPVRQYGARFGCFDFPGGAPLPVTLGSLGVHYRTGMATLNWTALYESNLKGYEIERSSNGSFFEKIGFTAARNQLGTTQQYQFSDDIAAQLSPVFYYRLHMVDLDGKSRYSNVVSVRRDKNSSSNGISISPNPAVSGSTQLRLQTARTGMAVIIISDASGRTVLTQNAMVTAGSNTIALSSIGRLGSGVYNLRVIAGEEMFTERLLINK